MTVRDGDSWSSVHRCTTPTNPGKVKRLVIVIVVRVYAAGQASLVNVYTQEQNRNGKVKLLFTH